MFSEYSEKKDEQKERQTNMYIIRLIIIYNGISYTKADWLIEIKSMEMGWFKEQPQWIRKCMKNYKVNVANWYDGTYIFNCVLILTCFALLFNPHTQDHKHNCNKLVDYVFYVESYNNVL